MGKDHASLQRAQFNGEKKRYKVNVPPGTTMSVEEESEFKRKMEVMISGRISKISSTFR
jgi:hypothetical protein